MSKKTPISGTVPLFYTVTKLAHPQNPWCQPTHQYLLSAGTPKRVNYHYAQLINVP